MKKSKHDIQKLHRIEQLRFLKTHAGDLWFIIIIMKGVSICYYSLGTTWPAGGDLDELEYDI